MPWWVAGYFVIFAVFAVGAITGELRKSNIFQAVVEAVPFVSSFAGGVAYWVGPEPTQSVAIIMGVMLALGVPLLVADCVVSEREARDEGEEDGAAMSVLTWVTVIGMFLPAYAWAGLYVARAWR